METQFLHRRAFTRTIRYLHDQAKSGTDLLSGQCLFSGACSNRGAARYKKFIRMHQSRSGDHHGSYCRPRSVLTCWSRLSNGTPDIDWTPTNATLHHVTSRVPLIGLAAWRLGDRAEKLVGERLLQIGCSTTKKKKKLLCDGCELQV